MKQEEIADEKGKSEEVDTAQKKKAFKNLTEQCSNIMETKKKKKTRPLIIGGLFDLIIPNTIDTGDDSLVKAQVIK